MVNQLPQDPLKLMSLVGALCSDLGAHDRALSIFQHLVAVRQNEPNALVCLALAHSRAGSQASALATLKLALATDPKHDMARVMLAIHLHHAKDPAAKAMLSAVLSDAQDPDAVALAHSVKDEILTTPGLTERATRHRYTRVGES
jgi:cytochrome c-type biogenesis protein CcmH/NrfG